MSWIESNRPLFARIYRWLAVTILVLTMLQPVLGGFGWFRDDDYIDIHAIVANTIFPLSVLLLLLALVAGFRQRTRMIGWSVALVILVTSQIGLGYSTRESLTSAAIHIPGGVLVFGTALIVALLSYGMTLQREAV
jgi:heme A synthase